MSTHGLPFKNREELNKHLETISKDYNGVWLQARIVREHDRAVLEFINDGTHGWGLSSETWYFDNDSFHTIRYNYLERKTAEYWMDNSCKQHRTGDLPAVTIYYPPTGSVMMEFYMQRGKLFREDDKPVHLGYYSSGERFELWGYGEGPIEPYHIPHREGDSPAIIYYFENGDVKEESWCTHGKYLRTVKYERETYQMDK